MIHYESKIKVNNEWRTLLVVKAEAAQEFPLVVEFREPGYMVQYFTGGVYREFHQGGEYVYWFLPWEKQVIVTQDPELAALAAERDGLAAQLKEKEAVIAEMRSELFVGKGLDPSV